ncbi:hypothetical protein BGX23_007641 [Mortierella sp. AD031]|nr:hypothetical protein BGX23_007641 [Mortierella sp. AD031]
MGQAESRFLDCQELVCMVEAYLDHKDFSGLAMTSRQMHSQFTPSLYRNLYDAFEHDNKKNLFSSIDAALALARNIHHVQELHFRSEDVTFFYNSLLAFQDSHPQAIGTAPSSKPRWLLPSDPRHSWIVLIPPMSQLTKIYIRVDPCTKRWYQCYLQSCNNRRALIPQACWMLRQSPHLRELRLFWVPAKTHQEIRLLTRTLFDLKTLKRVDIDWRPLRSGGTLWDDPSILPAPEYPDFGEGDDDEVAIPHRETPMDGLKELVLWRPWETVNMEAYIPIYQHCPNVEKLDITNLNVDNPYMLAALISALCPKVRHLRSSHIGLLDTGTVLSMIATALPEQQLESLDFEYVAFNQRVRIPKEMLERHSTSLRALYLPGVVPIDTKAMRVIFDECKSLEILRTHSHHRGTGPQIDLADAISRSWACTNLRRLELAVAIPDLPLGGPNSDTPYYLRAGPLVLSESERVLFAQLEKLYRQVASLTELRYLDLRAEERRAWSTNRGDFDRTYVKKSFLMLMSLGDRRTGRKGYLDLLDGLTKLRVLRGSVYLDVEETEETVDVREAVWMDAHFPVLERAEFFGSKLDSEEPTASFLWMQSQRGCHGRPHLSLYSVYYYGESDYY